MKAQKSDNQTFEPNVPEGIHQAVIRSIIDLGTQEINSQAYGLQEKRQVSISFEFPKVRKTFDESKGEQPCSLSCKYTLSMHEKAKLKKVCEKILGKKFTDDEAYDFDLKDILGKSCMVEVVHSNGYANIDNVMNDASEPAPKAENELRIFDLDNFDKELFDTFHEKVQRQIMNSPEYIATTEDKMFEPEDIA